MDTQHRIELFNKEMKVYDIIDLNFNLLLVLQRIGIDLKYVNLSIEDACRNCGIDPGTFVLICNVYTFNDYIPTSATLEASKLEDILKYLHNSHTSYTGNDLKVLAGSFNRLIEPCNEQQKQVITKFLTDYEEELRNHFAYEEDIVFPYVDSILRGDKSGDYSIEKFSENHESIDEKIEDLKNIVMKYLPRECDNEMRIKVLISIYHLQDDLKRHTYVENNILIPMVSRLEKNGN